jgi:hypothetical protein
VLTADDLREIDEVILDYLQEGRVTPVYCQQRILEDGHREEITRAYIHERLTRFVEHNHAENLLDTGLYALIQDPRSEA